MKPPIRVIYQSGTFLLFFVLTLVMYHPAREAGFVTDWLGWQQEYDAGSWKDVLNCFGYKGMQQVTQAVMYGLYRMFGTDGVSWYIIFSLLHAVNAWLLSGLFRRMFVRLGITRATTISLVGALLFLLCPYQAEVLIWRACVHYLLSAGFILLCLHGVMNYLDTRKRVWLGIAALIFFISLFTLEIVLVTPILAICLVFVWQRMAPETPVFRPVLPVALALFPFWLVFFVMNKVVLGTWIGHYGADTHLHFQWIETLSRFLKYFVKHVFFARYFRHEYKELVFGFLEKPAVVITGIGICLALAAYGIIFIKKTAARWIVAGMALAMFFISLAPVVTLYMLTLLHGENDRYGYVASMFLGITLALLFSFLKTQYRWLCWGIWISISVFYLHRTVQWWAVALAQKQQVLESFDWYEAKDIIVLNLPENIEGIHTFRIIGDDLSALKEDLALTKKKPFAGNIREVAYYNAVTGTDGVSAEVDTTANAIKVTFKQWGNWWWRNGIGASDYENETWRVDFQGQFYYLYLKKELPPNTVFIYWDGKEFLELRIKNYELRGENIY